MALAFKRDAMRTLAQRMTRQDQSVEEGGEAYQAGRDLTVNHGMNADDMAALMVAMAKQLSAFTAEANAKLDQRFHEFRDEVLKQFSNETSANKEAFNDPDFQFTVKSAQEAYARKGDGDLKVELVRLLAERSKQQSGSRVANILNEAIKVAGSLTKQEMSVLAILFVMVHVGTPSQNANQTRAFHESMLAPFLNDMPNDRNSFEYLESLRCITINAIVTRTSETIAAEKFRSQFTNGENSGAIRSFMTTSPILKAIYEMWDTNQVFQQSYLTSLGKALAHSTLVSKTGLNAPVEIWIN